MAKKRKLEAKVVEPPPPQEVEEEAEEVEEEEEAEEEDYEEEEEEEEGGGAQDAVKSSLLMSAVDRDDEEEPIEKILEPFSKDQLINLLGEAAEKHADVAEKLRRLADEDPVHRKIFVHGLGWDTNAETLINVFKEYGEIEDCRAVCDKVSGKSKGYGFILFKTRSGARKALKQPQKKIGNRMTACQLASIGPVLSPPAAGQAAMPVSGGVHSSSEYTLRKIYVSNVGAELDPQKLLVFFSKYGEIEEGPLGLDKLTGRPKGFCLFVYKTVEGARKALEEPHKNFDGHILHCQKAIDGPKAGKQQQLQQHHQGLPNTHFMKSEITNFMGPQGHLMAPSGPPAIPYNQGAAAQALNPALGQALTALLATQGAGLGLTNLLGTLGSASVGAAVNPGVAGAGIGVQGGYPNQAVSSGVVGGYGSQGAYGNQQMGQGSSSGRSQHGVGQMGGMAPYMGH